MKKIILLVTLFVVTLSMNGQDLNGKTFKIQSAAPNSKGKVIDADGYTLGKNGTKIQLWESNNATHQQWQFQFAGRGANNYYIISMSPRAGKFNFLEASGEHLANNGGIVQLWKNNLGGKNQLWNVTKNSNGTYRIANTAVAAKGASLDADGYTQGKNGGKVQLWQPLNNPNQNWKLIEIASKITSKITAPIMDDKLTPIIDTGWIENSLFPGETLKVRHKLILSGNQKYILWLAYDGKLRVHKYANNKLGDVIWTAKGSGFNNAFKNAKLILQDDGNLVVYDGTNKARWSSKTHPAFDAKFKNTNNKPVLLRIEDNGVLNLYTKSREIVWSSKKK